ncbi:MAG: antibiotic biosynthesis monooxygenase [Actinomycetota bacterium]|nr:antibiotic biosynthesis monooxygenase [Actinomycetota bacterium]
MIIEHAWLPVTPGREEQFAASIAAALPIIESAPGCHGAEVRRQIENPSTFLLLVRWTSVEAHMDFRSSPSFEAWRAQTHPFYESPATVTHFSDVLPR